MQYCKKCGIQVVGAKSCCPLCQRELRGEGDASQDIYPNLPTPKYSRNVLIRIVTLIAVIICVACVTINYLATPRIWWSVFVCAGTLCAWLAITVGISKRRNIMKLVSYQFLLLTLLVLVWDLAMGFRGWSVNYVFPWLCLAVMGLQYIIAKITKKPSYEYLIYLLIANAYGIVLVVLIPLHITTVVYPTAICVATNVVILTGLLLFHGKSMKEELSRKFHL